jgi:hypothetical protein
MSVDKPDVHPQIVSTSYASEDTDGRAGDSEGELRAMGVFKRLFHRWLSPKHRAGGDEAGGSSERALLTGTSGTQGDVVEKPRKEILTPDARDVRPHVAALLDPDRKRDDEDSSERVSPDLPDEFMSDSAEELMEGFLRDALKPDSGDGAASPLDPDESCHLRLETAPETREMFEGIAAVYVGPVRQFLARLQVGPVSTEWVEMCLPAVSMVGRSATEMGLQDLVPILDQLAACLSRAGRGDATTIDGTLRDAILEVAAQLAALLPHAFGVEEERDQKDGIILHSLLRQVPDVGKVTLDKIFRAGLTSLEMLHHASARELARTTGVPAHLCNRICQVVQDHCVHRSVEAVGSITDWPYLLEPVVAELAQHHQAFQDCDGDRSAVAEERKRHRRARQNAALRANVLLAEMGQVHLVDEIQRLPFDGRIQRLRDFMASLEQEAGLKSGNNGVTSGSGVAEHG